MSQRSLRQKSHSACLWYATSTRWLVAFLPLTLSGCQQELSEITKAAAIVLASAGAVVAAIVTLIIVVAVVAFISWPQQMLFLVASVGGLLAVQVIVSEAAKCNRGMMSKTLLYFSALLLLYELCTFLASALGVLP